MSNDSKSFKLGRDASTGKFVSVAKARNNPDRYVVEHVPKPGFGDVSKESHSSRPRPPRINKK